MNKLLTYLIGLLIIMVGGCQVSFEPETLVTLTPSPSMTITSTRTWTPTGSQTPVPADTSTPTQPPTKTATNSPTPTWTPVPTLAPDASLARIRELYQGTGPCELPCWWGITPGTTTWAQARLLLSELSPEYGPYYRGALPRYDYSFEVPANFEPLNLGFIEVSLYVQDEIIVAVGTSTGWIHQEFDYSLANLLAMFDQPDEIWIRHSPVEADFHIEYSINLFYKAQGVLLHISGEATLRDNTLVICPLNVNHGIFPMGIMLFTPNVTDSYEQLRELLYGRYDLAEDRYVPLSTITDGFGVSEFYNVYKNDNATECFGVNVE